MHSHLRRAPEGPEQVPHVPYRVGHARVLLEYGVDMEAQGDKTSALERYVRGTRTTTRFGATLGGGFFARTALQPAARHELNS